MKMTKIFLKTAVIFLSVILFNGCGLAIWNKGDYFNTDLETDAFMGGKIKKVAVLVFSDGKSYDGSGSLRFQEGWYPEEVDSGTDFEPDPSLKEQSLKLASLISDVFKEKGYESQVIQTNHDGDYETDDCIEMAKKAGADAVYIVNYKGLHKWNRMDSQTSSTSVSGNVQTTTTTTNYTKFEGFLYLPQAGMFRVSDSKQIWNFSWYGFIEEAHLPNLFVGFTSFTQKMIAGELGGGTANAHVVTTKLLFDPPYWKGSYFPIPDRKGLFGPEGVASEAAPVTTPEVAPVATPEVAPTPAPVAEPVPETPAEQSGIVATPLEASPEPEVAPTPEVAPAP
jgi:hypothetical protein